MRTALPSSEAIVTCSVLHYADNQRGWALGQMVWWPPALRQVPGLQWFRLMGCGRGVAFSALPDWNRYLLLAAWANREAANAFWTSYASGQIRTQVAATLHLWLSPTRTRGRWAGTDPLPPAQAPTGHDDQALAVLTRAHLRLRALPAFWRASRQATQRAAAAQGRLFSLGAGSNPLTELCTLSLWRDSEAMHSYAYQSQEHRAAMAGKRSGDWYREEYFARFAVRAISGTHPVAADLHAQLHPLPWALPLVA